MLSIVPEKDPLLESMNVAESMGHLLTVLAIYAHVWSSSSYPLCRTQIALEILQVYISPKKAI